MATRTRGKSAYQWQQVHDRVIAATVKLTQQGGQGVLVPGSFILTAAHCIKWSGEGSMALGDHVLESVETRDGRTLTAEVYAAEPVADIAALGPPDSQTFYDEWSDFDAFAESVKSIPLYERVLEVGKPLSIQVLTHKGKWVRGTVTRYGYPKEPPGSGISLKADSQIEGGTSGGPIVDETGHLIGLISSASEKHCDSDDCTGATPQPWLALPNWLVGKIMAATPRRVTPKKGK